MFSKDRGRLKKFVTAFCLVLHGSYVGMEAVLLASSRQQVRYALLDAEEARVLLLQHWAKKEFPSPNPLQFSEWKLPQRELDVRGFRLNQAGYVVVAPAGLAATTHVADSVAKGGGCFVTTSLLFASTSFTAATSEGGKSRPNGASRSLRAGGYVLSVGEEGVLFTDKQNELTFVPFDAPITRDPCRADGLNIYEVTFAVSTDEVRMRLAGRTIALK